MDEELRDARHVLTEVSEWSKLAGEGVSVAAFAGFDASGCFLVALGHALKPVPALSTIALTQADAGAQLIVAFEKGRVRHPVILGRVQTPDAQAPTVAELKLDGDRIVLQGKQRVELRCGEASLILTRSGKVLIRGNYVMSRSRGANKLKGAFVDIN